MPVEKCKLPAYLPSDPLLWFRAVEANFTVHKVLKDEERSALVIAALPEKQLQSVGHLLSLSSDAYIALKKRLLEVDGPSFQDSWERCLALPVLSAGERPTDIYRQLVSWLEKEEMVESAFLRATFLTKMPPDLKRMLLAKPDMSLSALVVFADSIHSATSTRASPAVYQLSSDSPDAHPRPEPVCALNKPPRVRQPPARAAQPPPSDGRLCWYHASFGVQARSCKPGCAWQPAGNGSRPAQ